MIAKGRRDKRFLREANLRFGQASRLKVKCTRGEPLSGEVVRTSGNGKESRRFMIPIIRNLDEC